MVGFKATRSTPRTTEDDDDAGGWFEIKKENSSSVSVCAYITGRVSLCLSLFVGVDRIKKLKNHGGRCGESGCGTG